MISFILGGAITGGAASALGAGAVASSGVAIASDFVLDYFSDADGGNLSNLVMHNEWTGSALANELSAALAHQKEDNAHIRRIKNSIEGLIPGIGIEAVMAGYRGLRAGRAVQSAGGTAEEATAAARQVASETLSRAAAAAAEENATVSDVLFRCGPEAAAMYEPQERAVQPDKADVNTSATSFDDDMPGGGRSLVDEVDVQQIRITEGLRQFVADRIPMWMLMTSPAAWQT